MKRLLPVLIFLVLLLAGCSSDASPVSGTLAPPKTPGAEPQAEEAAPGKPAALSSEKAAPPSSRAADGRQPAGYRPPPSSREEYLEHNAAARSRRPGSPAGTPASAAAPAPTGTLLYEGPPDSIPPELASRSDLVTEMSRHDGKPLLRIFEPRTQ
ncbi:MAG: hypothetical protein HY319_04190 [Armatimonadetes bacterium]|nr:hypothetical protein [Armatimonadota bacterium]